jgi:hypothetical protein
MKPEEISFANMVEKLPEAFPEILPAFKKQIAFWGEDPPAPHVVYEEILSKFLRSRLQEEKRNDPLLRRIFKFIELLAGHKEERVQEVAHNSICEPLCNDEVALQRAQSYMGPKTKHFCKSIITWDPPEPR